MAGGWSRDGAVQDQIDASVEDGVQRARSQLANGESAVNCEECDCPIPEERRKAIPEFGFALRANPLSKSRKLIRAALTAVAARTVSSGNVELPGFTGCSHCDSPQQTP